MAEEVRGAGIYKVAIMSWTVTAWSLIFKAYTSLRSFICILSSIQGNDHNGLKSIAVSFESIVSYILHCRVTVCNHCELHWRPCKQALSFLFMTYTHVKINTVVSYSSPSSTFRKTVLLPTTPAQCRNNSYGFSYAGILLSALSSSM